MLGERGGVHGSPTQRAQPRAVQHRGIGAADVVPFLLAEAAHQLSLREPIGSGEPPCRRQQPAAQIGVDTAQAPVVVDERFEQGRAAVDLGQPLGVRHGGGP